MTNSALLKVFPTWKIIKLCAGSKEEVEIELVVVSLTELGFKDRTTRKDIYIRAAELGLDLCPDGVISELRYLKNIGYPEGEWLVIAVEPINYSNLLNLKYGCGSHWLGARFEDFDYSWNCHDLFIFRRCK